MFSIGQCIFGMLFFLVFAVIVSYQYKRDSRLHKRYYKGTLWILSRRRSCRVRIENSNPLRRLCAVLHALEVGSEAGPLVNGAFCVKLAGIICTADEVRLKSDALENLS